MFTGIIKALSKVKFISKTKTEMEIGIQIPTKWKVKNGNSIAVNGVCLTVTNVKNNTAYFFCQKETMDITNLKFLSEGDEVNLEQAMKMSDELGGHIVQGHVDCTVICDKVLVIGEGWRYTLKLPSVKPKGVVLKGSVALDGISLTISRLEKNTLSVDIIPFTHENTNIKHWKKGTLINLETDVIGKYVEKYLSPEKNIWSNPVKSKKN